MTEYNEHDLRLKNAIENSKSGFPVSVFIIFLVALVVETLKFDFLRSFVGTLEIFLNSVFLLSLLP